MAAPVPGAPSDLFEALNAADLEAAVVNRKKRSVPLRRPGNSSRNAGGGKTNESQSQTQMLAESTLE